MNGFAGLGYIFGRGYYVFGWGFLLKKSGGLLNFGRNFIKVESTDRIKIRLSLLV